MFRLQYLSGSCIAVLSVGLLLGGWTQTESAGAEQSKATGDDIEKALADPQTTAMVDAVARRLPGNENTWYVLVLRARNCDTKNFQIVMASGKTAAVLQIAKFLQRNPKIARNPQSYTHWLHLEMYPNSQLAASRCQAISDYVQRCGYR